MAHDIIIRAPMPSDVSSLVKYMRALDIAEIEAVSGPDIHAAVREAINISAYRYTALYKSSIIGVFGCAPLAALAGIGSPWFFGTALCSRVGISMTRYACALIEVTAWEYPHLLNYIDERQRRSVEWLRRLGFRVYPPEPYGIEGRPFHKFELNRKVS